MATTCFLSLFFGRQALILAVQLLFLSLNTDFSLSADALAPLPRRPRPEGGCVPTAWPFPGRDVSPFGTP